LWSRAADPRMGGNIKGPDRGKRARPRSAPPEPGMAGRQGTEKRGVNKTGGRGGRKRNQDEDPNLTTSGLELDAGAHTPRSRNATIRGD